ncbi:CadD family cadmium resistance transporter [Allobacillus sp. GCM10007489]|uniref:CadD family cadmium resistance transporter n=1 Tax=unclassified Allobacillus TaxID=2628859 RepID=UPI00210610F0|nr:CadD family cadmium resistance transporter [Allobacillus sp. SKP2-8]
MVRAAIIYTATAFDLIAILLIFFAKAETKKQRRQIYIGQFIGSSTLIVISLFLAYVLGFVPDKWILGLLGLVPIYFGLKVAFFGDDEGAAAEKQMDQKGLGQLVRTVTVVVIATCGADNIGLFTPYFITLEVNELITTLIVFFILIFVVVFSAGLLSNIPGVGEVIEKFSRWIIAIVYIGVGVLIIYENKTVQTLLSFLN